MQNEVSHLGRPRPSGVRRRRRIAARANHVLHGEHQVLDSGRLEELRRVWLLLTKSGELGLEFEKILAQVAAQVAQAEGDIGRVRGAGRIAAGGG